MPRTPKESKPKKKVKRQTMELIEDDGILQLVYLPRGTRLPVIGKVYYLDRASDAKKWSIKRYCDYWGYNVETIHNAPAGYIAGTSGGTAGDPCIVMTYEELFPRKNEYGDVHP